MSRGFLIVLVLSLIVQSSVVGATAVKRRVTFDDLECDWFEVELTKGDGGGFFPVFLPFSQTTGNKTSNSLAFPFLLSFRFDWVPDNICTRHPFFIYKRDRRFFEKYKKPSKDIVVSYARSWGASHVIGGSIFQTGAGWGGKLEVYNRAGMMILRKKYEPKLSYFDLMGRMVIDWMAFRKQEVSEGLKKELIRPMTTDMKTIKFLETAALAPERSKEEWLIYERILDIDPDFAEVRAWRANQMRWQDQDDKKAALERAIALESHLVFIALKEFNPRNCPDNELVEMFSKEWLPAAISMAPDNIVIVARKLNNDYGWGRWPVEKADDLLDIAYKRPYDGSLLWYLGCCYDEAGMYEKSIPVYINALRSGYLWGSSQMQKRMFDRIIEGFEKKGEKEKADIARKLKKRYLRY